MENTLSPCSVFLPRLWWPLVTFCEVRGAGCHPGRGTLSSPPWTWWEVCSKDSRELAACHGHSGRDTCLLPEGRLGADGGRAERGPAPVASASTRRGPLPSHVRECTAANPQVGAVARVIAIRIEEPNRRGFLSQRAFQGTVIPRDTEAAGHAGRLETYGPRGAWKAASTLSEGESFC